jgi:hypothetical protein
MPTMLGPTLESIQVAPMPQPRAVAHPMPPRARLTRQQRMVERPMPPRRIVADLTLAVNPMVVDLMVAVNLMAEAGTDNG